MASKRKLHMPEWEIVEFYRRAADPRQQISILADLNITDKATIRQVLERNGITPPPEPAYSPRGGRPKRVYANGGDGYPTKAEIMKRINEKAVKSALDCEKAVDLYLEHKSDAEIAGVFGVSDQTVWNWRKARGLPCLRKFKKLKTETKTGREELVKLIHGCAEMIADYLIAQGVIVTEGQQCKD